MNIIAKIWVPVLYYNVKDPKAISLDYFNETH